MDRTKDQRDLNGKQVVHAAGLMRPGRVGQLAATACALFVVAGCQPNCEQLSFPPPDESAYVLPFPPGKSYLVSQSYCNRSGGHRNRIAYDFKMPLGAPITAARSGVVEATVDRYVDGDLKRGHNNRILIRHEDRSVAWYAHLRHKSVAVQPGDSVAAGEFIAECGNTGNTGNLPHLHFEVFASHPFVYSDAIPIAFSNAVGPLDSRGGLRARQTYTASE